MDICHTVPLEILIKHPEFLDRMGDSLIIRKESVINSSDAIIAQFKKLVNSCGKDVILWTQEKTQKSDLRSLVTKVGASRIILPVRNVTEARKLESGEIASISSNTQKEFITTLNYVLHSKTIRGIGLEIKSIATAYKHLSLYPPKIRPRLLKNIDTLFGLSLYEKPIYCLGSTGDLAEIYELSQLTFVKALATDAAFTFANYNVRLNQLKVTPDYSPIEYAQKYQVDAGSNFKLKNLELTKENIKSMEKHNETN